MSQSNDSGLNFGHLEVLAKALLDVREHHSKSGDVRCRYCGSDLTEYEQHTAKCVTNIARAALANQPAPTVPEPVAVVRRWCKGDAEWTNWKFVDAAEYAKRKDDDAFQVVVLAHQPAQEQANQNTPSVDHRNTYVLLHGYTAQQEPVTQTKDKQ